MRALERHGAILLALLTLSLAWTSSAWAQSDRAAGSSSLGGFIGFTDRDDADFTFGAEYEYQMQNQWSVGALAEHTSDYFRGQDATVVLGTAHYRPAAAPRLKLTGGAGVEFKDIGGDDALFRAGVGYDLFIEDTFTLTPRISLDFGNDNDEQVVIGATFSRRF